MPYSYLWSTGDTTSSISVNPPEITNYTVVVTDVVGYSAVDDMSIDLLPAPLVTTGSNSPVCEGDQIELTSSATAIGSILIHCTVNCDMPTGYCSSGAINIEDAEIDEVILNTINNNTSGDCATYSDFTSMSTTLVKGDTYPFSVTLGTCGYDNLVGGTLYIDWNRDGDFDDLDEDIYSFGPDWTTTTYTTDVTIPTHAVVGITRMRIVASDVMFDGLFPPCALSNWGETEDYSVEIIEMAPNSISSYESRRVFNFNIASPYSPTALESKSIKKRFISNFSYSTFSNNSFRNE